MNELIIHQFDGIAVDIALRPEDGYFNATAMCQATGKRFNNYSQTQFAKDFLEALSSVTGIPVTGLVLVNQGGIPALQGTWVHPDVAVSLGQWCSAYYGVAVAQWVNSWRTRPAHVIPQTKSEALFLAAKIAAELEQQSQVTLVVARRAAEQMIELKDKDVIIEAQTSAVRLKEEIEAFLARTTAIGEAAALIIPEIRAGGDNGQNILYNIFREWKWVCVGSTRPHGDIAGKGYLESGFTPYALADGTMVYPIKTRITNLGITVALEKIRTEGDPERYRAKAEKGRRRGARESLGVA